MIRSRTSAGDDADWGRYPETILVFGSRPSLRIDLRCVLSPDQRAALARIGLVGEFAVITASDPQGEDLDSAENARRSSALETRLIALGLPFVHVEAGSPDNSHREASVAVGVAKQEAVSLAREFRQLAIFWYDGARFWIVGALADVPPIPLPAS